MFNFFPTAQSEKQLAPEEIKLVLTMGGKAPGMVGDDVIDVIDSFGKNIPIYGLFASDAFNFSKYRVFCNERSGQNAQAFVFVSGNVNPRFLQVKSISGKANFSYEVTKSNENQVFRLGNGTFVEALEKANMISQKNNVIADYIMTRDLNVRQAEVFVKKFLDSQNAPDKKKVMETLDIRFALSLKEVETKFKKGLGAKTKIKVLDSTSGRGRIVIDYKDYEDLDRLTELLCGQ